MDQTTLFGDLERGFRQLDGNYAKLDARTEAQIVRWRYATRSAFELRYDFIRRTNAVPGTLSDTEPIQEYMYHAYGYDALGRLLNDSFFQSEDVPRTCTFYEYHAGYTDIAEFQVKLYTESYILVRVGRLVHPDPATPECYAEYAEAPDGRITRLLETYEFDVQGRPQRITITRSNEPGAKSGAAADRMKAAMDQQRTMAKMLGREAQFEESLPQFQTILNDMLNRRMESTSLELYEYEGARLVRIVDQPVGGGRTSILYEAPRAGDTDASLFEAARSSLRQRVIDEIRDETPDDRSMFSMVISYDAVCDDSILVYLCPQAQRDEWEAQPGDHTYASLGFLEPGTSRMYQIDELPEEYDRYVRNMRRDHRWEDIRTLMQRVAQDLNAYDWSRTFEPTDDFIVFAADYEAFEQFEEDIIASIPAAKLKLLRARGYVQ